MAVRSVSPPALRKAGICLSELVANLLLAKRSIAKRKGKKIDPSLYRQFIKTHSAQSALCLHSHLRWGSDTGVESRPRAERLRFSVHDDAGSNRQRCFDKVGRCYPRQGWGGSAAGPRDNRDRSRAKIKTWGRRETLPRSWKVPNTGVCCVPAASTSTSVSFSV